MAKPRRLGYGQGTVYKELMTDEDTGKQWVRWRGELRAAGLPRRRVSGATKTEVTDKLDALLDLDKAGASIGKDPKLGEWLDWYMDTVVEAHPDLDPNTVANYRWAFGKLEPLRGLHLRELRSHQIDARLKALATVKPARPVKTKPKTKTNGDSAKTKRGGKERRLGRSSLGRIRTYLAAALDEAVRQGVAVKNEARLAHLPKTEPPKAKRALTQNEAKAVLAAVSGDRNEALFMVALMLGLRPGEVLGLRWDAVDLKAKTLAVTESLQRKPGGGVVPGKVKADSSRTLRLPSPVVEALRAHKTLQAAEALKAPVWEQFGLVFPNSIGAPIDPSNLRRTVKAVCDRAKVDPISPNELRHSAATLLIEAGVPMHIVADLHGHKSTRMLEQHYRHKRGIVDVTEGQERMLG